MKLTSSERAHLNNLLKDIKSNPKVLEMKNYIQHGTISTYEHCESVTELSFYINRKFHLGADEKVLVTGAFLHDFYLYDWHNEDDGSHNWHGYIHAATAAENARKYFNIEDKVYKIIYSHMWPLNLTRIPRSREAFIVCMADKYCSTIETVAKRRKKGEKRKGKYVDI